MPLDDDSQDPHRQFLRFVKPTARERPFGEDEIIVSKTDARGVITYANTTFLRVAEMTEEEALGAPHSIIRHPDMPRCVFKLMWDTLGAGREIFAYVKNLSRSGDHYWVFAHVTPTIDGAGRIVGFHSNRRKPARASVSKAEELYRQLRAVESTQHGKQAAIAASTARMTALLAEKGIDYDEFVFTL